MAKQALAVLESALRARKLDRTLTTALPPLERRDESAFIPTSIAVLDACLHGGLPRGQLSEIVGPRSSGRTTLLLQMMAVATRRGEIAVVVDTFDRLDVASAGAAGIDPERLLWIRGQTICEHGPRLGEGSLEQTVVGRALKALNLVLQAGGFAAVAIDLADVSRSTLTRIPFTTWLRIQRIIEGSDTACVLVAPQPLARSAGGLTLSLTACARWAGEADRSRHVIGADLTVRVVSPRRRVDGEVSMSATVHH